MARKVLGIGLILLLFGVLAWSIRDRAARGVAYWQNAATVNRAEDALAKGRYRPALLLLSKAGTPGEERLGRMLAACHNNCHWQGLVEALRDSIPEVRDAVADVLERSPEENLCAAEALAAVGDERGVQALASALVDRPDGAHDPGELASLGAAGLEALASVARCGPEAALDPALIALARSESPEATDLLARLVVDRESRVRHRALRVAAARCHDRLRSLYPHFLTHPDARFRAEAVYQYGVIEGTNALGELSTALDDDEALVRGKAVEALLNIEGPEADSLLIRALGDPDADVVRRAVRAVGWRRSRKAEPELARIYPESSTDLKLDIATALCWIDSPLGPKYKTLWEEETGETLVLSSEWDG